MAPERDDAYPVTISRVKTGRSFRVRNKLTAVILTITTLPGVPLILPRKEESRVMLAGK